MNTMNLVLILLMSIATNLAAEDDPAMVANLLNRKAKEHQEALLKASTGLNKDQIRNHIESLKAIIGSTKVLDLQIRSIPFDKYNVQRILDAERLTACAVMNCWSSLTRITECIRVQEKCNDLYTEVLSITDDNACFSGLLTIYRDLDERTAFFKKALNERLAIEKSNPQTENSNRAKVLEKWKLFCADCNDPIKIRLFDDAGLDALLNTGWKTADGKFELLSVESFIGSVTDEYGPGENKRSIWALINSMLDTWNTWGESTSENDPSLSPLASWLMDFSTDSRTKRLDIAQSLERISKLSKYLTFRQAVAVNPNLLTSLSIDLAIDRKSYDPKGPIGITGEHGTVLRLLIDAAGPMKDGSALFDASVWMKYVMLLSYQNCGGSIVFSDSPMSVAAQCKKFSIPINFTNEYHLKTRAQGMLRWYGKPPAGHSAQCIADLCGLTQRFLICVQTVDILEKSKNYRDYWPELKKILNEFKTSIKDSSVAEWNDKPSFNKSATKTEKIAILKDWDLLHARIETYLNFQNLTAEYAEQQNISNLSIMYPSALGCTAIASDCDLSMPPDDTFENYAKRTKKAAQEMLKNLDASLLERQMRRTYKEKQIELNVIELEKDTAQFALSAARNALKMAETYQRLAAIDKSISEILKQAAEARRQAALSDHKAASIRSSLAVRARDMAAAKVQALEEVIKQAPQMIKEAKEELRKIKEKLIAQANHLEEEKQRSFFKSLIKSIIRVVGVALGPFTVGASIAISEAVVAAVNFVDSVSSMNWNDLGSIAHNISSITQDVSSTTSSVIKAIGSESLKQDWANFQKSCKKSVQDAKESFNDLLKSVNSVQDLITFSNAAACNLPVSYTNGALMLDLKKLPKIEITNQDFQNKLKNVLLNGGVFVNDIKTRLKGASTFAIQNKEQIEAALKTEFDSLIVVAPPEVVKKIDEFNKTVSQFEKAKSELKALLFPSPSAGPQAALAAEKMREALSRIIASGMAFTVDQNGKLIAVGRNIDEETKKMTERLNALKKRIVEGKLGQIAKNVQEIINEIEKKSKSAEESQDSDTLRKIAASIDDPQNPDLSYFSKIDKGFDELEKELTEAQGDFDDASLVSDAAGYDETAALYRDKVANLQVDAADLDVQKSMLEVEIAESQFTRDQNLLSQCTSALDASDLRHKKAIFALESAALDCADYGIDISIETHKSDDLNMLVRILHSGSLLKSNAIGLCFSGPFSRRSLAGNFCGMLRWLRLFHLRTSSDQENWQRDFIDWYILFTKSLSEIETEGQLRQFVNDVDSWTSSIEKYVDDNAGKVATVEICRWSGTPTLTPEASGGQPYSYLVEFLADPASQYLMKIQSYSGICSSIISRIDISFGDDLELDPIVPGEENVDILVITNKLIVTLEPNTGIKANNLRFFVRPPVAGRITKNGADLAPHYQCKHNPVDSIDVQIFRENIAKDVENWKKSLDLCGHRGVWSIFLFDTSIAGKSAGERKKILEQYKSLNVSVLFPTLRIDRK